jgi:hypothetical protein
VELDVTVRGEVRGNTTMGTICSSATLLSSLNNNVSDNAFVGVETFLLSVGLEVEEQLADGLGWLLGPSAGGGALDLALGVSWNCELSEADDRLVLEDVVHVSDRLLEAETLNSESSVVSVLEVGAEVSDLGFGSYSRE